VSRMFARSGANVIDADSIARQVVEPDQPAWRAIVDTFGREVICPDGSIDRRRLGDIVSKTPICANYWKRLFIPTSRLKWSLGSGRFETAHPMLS
jgi:dephospho-CoA kinase